MQNTTPPSPAQPSPALLFETVNGYQRTAALKGAIDLELFTAVAEGNQTVPALARRCGAAERGVRVLCDALVVMGFLTKAGDRYALTPDAALFLDRRSPAYMGGTVEFLLSPAMYEAFRDVAAAVRQGGTALPHAGTLAPEHAVWVRFARAMGPAMAHAAEQVALRLNAGAGRPLRVLDISASHGYFGLAFARQNPNATVVALDWPNVLEVAKENAEKLGAAARFQTIAGSAFEADFGPAPYDVVLLPNFLHHFDVPTCERLLRKVRAALNEGGRVATLEFVPDENRITPPNSAMFALTMLATTPGGDAYTFAEYESMFANAGFGRSEQHDLPGVMQRLIVSYR
jgi:ubiquinone/menaquinone biosynthesis C-methylase UbiE